MHFPLWRNPYFVISALKTGNDRPSSIGNWMYYFTCSFVSFFRFCRRKRDLVFFRKKIKYRQFCILDDLKIAAISEKNVPSSLDRQSPTNHVPILAWLFKIIYVKLLFCFCLYDLLKVSWKTMKNGRKACALFSVQWS